MTRARPALLAALALLGVAVVAGGACREQTAGRVPATMTIPVEVDGKVALVIDAALLAAHAPEFREGERRGWRLAALLGDVAARDGARLEVEHVDGTRRVFAAIAGGREPVLAVGQGGEVTVAALRADEPLPQVTRASPVPARIRVIVPRAGQGKADGEERVALSAAEVEVLVSVDGGAPVAWRRADLARVARRTIHGEGRSGETREIFSLRDLVTTFVGPGARAVALEGEQGRVLVDEQLWRDPAMLPSLRINRRAQVKFQWLDGAGEPLEESSVRDVRAMAIVTK